MQIITILVQFPIINVVIWRFGDFWSNFLYDFILCASNTHEFMKTVPLLTLKYHIWFGPPSGLNLDLNLNPPPMQKLKKLGLKWSTLRSHFYAHFRNKGTKFLTEMSELPRNLKKKMAMRWLILNQLPFSRTSVNTDKC